MQRPRTLVGRDEVIGRIRRRLDRVLGVTGQAIVIEGPAGIGKTAVADRLIDAAAERGFAVQRGTARQLETDLPFAPLAEALALDPRSDDERRARLGQLLRGDGGAGLGGHQRRWRIIDDIVDLLDKRARDAALLLLIEDVHWADVDTATVLARVARSLDDLPIALIVTSRPEPRPDHIGALLSVFDAVGALDVKLGPLTPTEVAELTATVVGAPPTATLAAILDRAGGNPLYVLELLEALDDEGALESTPSGTDARATTLPPSLRLTVIRRIGFLPEATVAVLRAASVLGESARLDRLAALTRRTTTELAEVLAPAYRSGLLDSGPDAVTFRHALIRDALYEDLPGPARVAMHADAAQVLLDAAALPGEIATHLAHALAPGDVATAIRLLDAADELLETNPDVAEDHAQRVLDALPTAHPARLRARILLAQAAARTGRPAEAEALAHELDNDGLDVTARLELWRAVILARHMRGEASIAALDAYEQVVREAALPAARRSGHLALLAFALRWEQPARADKLAGEALAPNPDPTTQILALTARFPPALMHGAIEEAYGMTARAVELVRTAGLEISWVGVEALAAFAFLRSNDPADDHEHPGVTALTEALVAAEAHGLAYAVATLHDELARTYWFQGDFDAAVASAETALRAVADTGYGENSVGGRSIRAGIALTRGDYDTAAIHRDAVPEAAISYWRGWPLLEAADRLRRGDVERAWELVRPALRWMEEDDPIAYMSLIWSLPVVEAALAVGETATAAAWADYVERWAAIGGEHPITAVAAATRAAVERTPARARAAIAAARASAVYPFRLSGYHLAGAILAENDVTGEAVAILREGRDLAAAANATVIVAWYDALLRDLGVRRGAVGDRGRPDTGWEALTEAELRVVELVAHDLTYREIGERLFISRRTVETHVANARRKLDCANRAELARAHLDRRT
ncbi:MAG: AAA family ATPase [Actinobacteria bacterium]|nr:AAA family ATPase [Actinomycetota bacterium]